MRGTKRFHVRASETGEFIDDFDNLVDAGKFYRECENDDRADGCFTEGFYEIYDSEKEEIVADNRIIGPLQSVTVVKKLRKSGNSLMLNVTGEAALIGADRGDLIEITITKARESPDVVRW